MGKKMMPVYKVNLGYDTEISWYVLKTDFNYEQKAADNILKLAKGRGYDEEILEVIVPVIETTETVIDKHGAPKKRKRRTKVYGLDGYIWVRMRLTPETWNLVRNATGISGWLNTDGKPFPLTREEIEGVMKACQYKGFVEGSKPAVGKFDIKENDIVEITEGPMEGLQGKVININMESQVVKLENDNGFKFEVEFYKVKLA